MPGDRRVHTTTDSGAGRLGEMSTLAEDRFVGRITSRNKALRDGHGEGGPDEHDTFRGGSVMTWLVVISAGGLMAWIVEWGQRHCEQWCQERDKNL